MAVKLVSSTWKIDQETVTDTNGVNWKIGPINLDSKGDLSTVLTREITYDVVYMFNEGGYWYARDVDNNELPLNDDNIIELIQDIQVDIPFVNVITVTPDRPVALIYVNTKA